MRTTEKNARKGTKLNCDQVYWKFN